MDQGHPAGRDQVSGLRASPVEIASWVAMAAALALVLRLRLLSALLAGLLVFDLVHMIAPMLQRRVSRPRARVIAVALLAATVIGLVSAAVVGVIAFIRSDVGSLPGVVNKLAEILESARKALPAWFVAYLPDDIDDVSRDLSTWLKENAAYLRSAGAETMRALVHIVVGMVVGAMLAMREAIEGWSDRPLARALTQRAAKLADAFRRVVFAQVRISVINTAFTAVYLGLVLPVFDIHLPLVKTMIAITFVAGLLPVVGNLISNSVILIASLGVSVYVAFASLVFLIVIHKLEYFLNARIIGSRIHARPWELLIAMLVMEAAFGLPGLVAAPIYYAYLKAELAQRGLI
jgi:predicted PurR-regulated permease PerM